MDGLGKLAISFRVVFLKDDYNVTLEMCEDNVIGRNLAGDSGEAGTRGTWHEPTPG